MVRPACGGATVSVTREELVAWARVLAPCLRAYVALHRHADAGGLPDIRRGGLAGDLMLQPCACSSFSCFAGGVGAAASRQALVPGRCGLRITVSAWTVRWTGGRAGLGGVRGPLPWRPSLHLYVSGILTILNLFFIHLVYGFGFGLVGDGVVDGLWRDVYFLLRALRSFLTTCSRDAPGLGGKVCGSYDILAR